MAAAGGLAHRIAIALGAALVAWLIRGLGATWRIQVVGEDPGASGKPFVGALWHQGLLCAAFRYRGCGGVIPVSLSHDGDRVVGVLQRLGYGPSPRGSSSRAGRAVLAGLIRAAREGRIIGMLCDGPRGPARRAKPGVLGVARATGLAIHPIGFAARPARSFGSWDRALLPLPFARVAIVYGEPLRVARRADREQLDAALRELEQRLDRVTDDAERSLRSA
ncbi:MAG: lysophospholipid acyltransferase family protein [Myxococcota bacterium]|nr:lysophospholipid acyltransferase family protein [Myxococcota bacterium]